MMANMTYKVKYCKIMIHFVEIIVEPMLGYIMADVVDFNETRAYKDKYILQIRINTTN